MDHAHFMQRCLQLAANGLGSTSPNPMVGSVIVHDGRIIGEGWHRKAGEAHAEVNAIASVKDTALLKESTLYVNLEPCAHFGKTPPCADLIIEKKVPQVVIGCRDPFGEVNGRGIERLHQAGVEVIVDVLKDESEHLNRRFFTFHRHKRPYIILKWAQTRDGYLDRERTKNKKGINWITAPETRSLVHHWRAQEDAIMVGAQTVINDNPSLSARDVKGRQPTRIILNPDQSIPADSAIFDGKIKTLYFSGDQESNKPRVSQLRLQAGEDALERVLTEAFNRQIQSILVEGGAFLLRSFMEKGLWDEARVFTGNQYFKNGLKAPVLNEAPAQSCRFGPDELRVSFKV